MTRIERTPVRCCPHCHTPMEPCDYSPIYGHNWYHPRHETCQYSESNMFGGHDLDAIIAAGEDEE